MLTEVKENELEEQRKSMQEQIETLKSRMENQKRAHAKSLEDLDDLAQKHEEIKSQHAEAQIKTRKLAERVKTHKAQTMTLQKQFTEVQGLLTAREKRMTQIQQKHTEEAMAMAKKQVQSLTSMENAIGLCMNLDELIRPDLTCPVCFEVFDTPTMLFPCAHTFCKDCISTLRQDDGVIACSECGTRQIDEDATCVNVHLNHITSRYSWWQVPIQGMQKLFQEVQKVGTSFCNLIQG